MNFVWDKKKAELNLKNHGVSFPEAATAFDDVFAKISPDEAHGDDEERMHLIGVSMEGNVLLVVFVEKMENAVYRIISARKANRVDEIEYWRRRS